MDMEKASLRLVALLLTAVLLLAPASEARDRNISESSPSTSQQLDKGTATGDGGTVTKSSQAVSSGEFASYANFGDITDSRKNFHPGSGSVIPSSGNYTYTYPIYTPSGFSGQKPSLALSYNSSISNNAASPVGTGWSIPLNCISRHAKTEINYGPDPDRATNPEPTYYRGGTPEFKSTDTYYLGSEPLLEQTHPQNGMTYYVTQHASAVRVIRSEPDNTWTLYRPDGSKTIYGGPNAFGDASSGNDGTFYTTHSWCEYQTIDPNGNTIEYTYYYNDPQLNYGDNSFYLKEINYSFNGLQNSGQKIKFHYSTDGDIFEASSGVPIHWKYRLDSIDVYTLAGVLARTYTFTYTYSADTGLRLLESISMQGKLGGISGEVYTTSFQYSANTHKYFASTSAIEREVPFAVSDYYKIDYVNNLPVKYHPSRGAFGTGFADFNGDGYLDFYTAWANDEQGRPPATTKKIWLGSESGWTPANFTPPTYASWWNNNYKNEYRDWSIIDKGVRVLDVNGDGKADWLRAQNKEFAGWAKTWVYYYSDLPAGGNPSLYNSGLTIPTYFVMQGRPWQGEPWQHTNWDMGVRFADLNGDGLPDMIRAYLSSGSWDPANTRVWLNRGGWWQYVPDGRWQMPVPIVQVQNSNPNGKSRPMTFGNGVFLVDLNGDGLTDIIRGYKKTWATAELQAWINTGSSFVSDSRFAPPYPLLTEFGWGADTPQVSSGVQFADVNGDGYTDLVRCYDDLINSAYDACYTHLGSPTGWKSTTDWVSPYPLVFRGTMHDTDIVQDLGVRIVDLNGDGFADIVKGNVYADGSGNINKSTLYNLSGTLGTKPNLLISVSEPGGATTTITYEPGTPLGAPNSYIVKSIEKDPGFPSGPTLKTTYTYSNGKMDYLRRQFLGFESTEVVNIDTASGQPVGARVKTWYAQDHVSAGKPLYRIVSAGDSPSVTDPTQPSSSWFSRTVYTYCTDGEQLSPTIDPYSLCSTSTAPYFRPLVKKVSEIYDYGAATLNAHSRTVTYEYDRYGNTTRIVDEADSPVGTFEGTEIITEAEYLCSYSQYPSSGREYWNPGTNEMVWRVSLPVRKKILYGTSSGSSIEKRRTEFYYDARYDGSEGCDIPLSGRPNLTLTKTIAGSKIIKEEWHYTTDNLGHVATHVSPYETTPSQVISYSYAGTPVDGLFLHAVTDALGRTATLDYDSNGIAIRSTDINGVQNSVLSYDAYGRPLRIEAASNSSNPEITEYEYPSPNEKVSRTYVAMDANANGIQELGESGPVENHTYVDGFGRVFLTIAYFPADGFASAVHRGYDELGRVAWETRPIAAQTVGINEYDGNVPAGSYPTYTSYDQFGRITSVVMPNNTMIRNEYPTALITTIYDQDGKAVKSYKRDVRGNLISVTEHITSDALQKIHSGHGLNYASSTPAGDYTTHYSYNQEGKLLSITNPLGETISYTYDELGRVSTVSDPDRGIMNVTYDQYGNVKTASTAENSVSYQYDLLNRPVRAVDTNDPSCVMYEIVYDDPTPGNFGLGRLATERSHRKSTCHSPSWDSEMSYVYDELGRIIEKTVTILGKTRTLNYSYGSGGQLLQISSDYPQVETVLYSYDSRARAYSATSVQYGNIVTAQDYDDFDRPVLRLLGNGTNVSWQYYTDGVGALRPQLVTADSGAQMIMGLSYTYDRKGNINTVEDLVKGEVKSFRYDDLNRLVSLKFSSTGGLRPYDLYRLYDYDPIGNIKEIQTSRNIPLGVSPDSLCKDPKVRFKRETVSGSAALSANRNGSSLMPAAGSTQQNFISCTLAERKLYSYSAPQHCYSAGLWAPAHAVGSVLRTSSTGPNALDSYCYNREGNTVERNGTTLDYDILGQLSRITSGSNSTEYLYSVSGSRLAKISANGSDITRYYDGLVENRVNDLPQWRKSLYSFDGVAVAERNLQDQITYVLSDHLSSPQVTLGAQGNVKGTAEYWPYGSQKESSWNTIDPDTSPLMEFGGQERDEESGLYYYRSRYYDPVLGRFLQPDSVIPDPSNPQALNPYTYVNNNPVNNIDPDGHEAITLTTLALSYITASTVRASYDYFTDDRYVDWGWNVSDNFSLHFRIERDSIDDFFRDEVGPRISSFGKALFYSLKPEATYVHINLKYSFPGVENVNINNVIASKLPTMNFNFGGSSDGPFLTVPGKYSEQKFGFIGQPAFDGSGAAEHVNRLRSYHTYHREILRQKRLNLLKDPYELSQRKLASDILSAMPMWDISRAWDGYDYLTYEQFSTKKRLFLAGRGLLGMGLKLYKSTYTITKMAVQADYFLNTTVIPMGQSYLNGEYAPLLPPPGSVITDSTSVDSTGVR
ncbi:MAG: hypothetical protein D6719_09140 [Candidatus Dadabacteria bacterium]|nr:MAG: hypothetical protein D6719_09140 [Candidatus Dadabacteria bacterium]